MQQWQTEISKTAAMAALLASNAGWWQLETLLAPLSAQAAAGVRPELLPLMEVSACCTASPALQAVSSRFSFSICSWLSFDCGPRQPSTHWCSPHIVPQVAGMQPSHAAALHAAGFLRPELLVCASESEVAAALAAKLPNPHKRKHADKQ
jgi:hypothetical protein